MCFLCGNLITFNFWTVAAACSGAATVFSIHFECCFDMGIAFQEQIAQRVKSILMAFPRQGGGLGKSQEPLIRAFKWCTVWTYTLLGGTVSTIGKIYFTNT